MVWQSAENLMRRRISGQNERPAGFAILSGRRSSLFRRSSGQLTISWVSQLVVARFNVPQRQIAMDAVQGGYSLRLSAAGKGMFFGNVSLARSRARATIGSGYFSGVVFSVEITVSKAK